MDSEKVAQCPWCERYALKSPRSCNYVICGRQADGRFVVGAGCGRCWCFLCEKKLCRQMYDAQTGRQLSTDECHDHAPGSAEFLACSGEDFCPGGHDSHKKAVFRP